MLRAFPQKWPKILLPIGRILERILGDADTQLVELLARTIRQMSGRQGTGFKEHERSTRSFAVFNHLCFGNLQLVSV